MTTWTVFHGTLEEDTTNFRTGTKSLKYTINPAVDTSGTITRNCSLNFSGNGHLRVYFYCSHVPAATELIEIKLSVDAGFTKNFKFGITPSTKDLHTGWNSIDIYEDEWTNTGGASWSDTFIRLQFGFSPVAGTIMIVSFDSLLSGLIGRPCVMMTFDDEYFNAYANAFYYMKKRGVPGTMYVRSAIIGTADFMTAAQILEMSAAGWCIGNHTTDHTNLTTLNQADQQTKLAGCKTALDALGLTQNSMDVAYPQGGYNNNTFLAMAAEGMETGRTVNSAGVVLPGGDNSLVIGCWSVHNTDTLVSVKAAVDNAITYNRCLSLLFHEIVPATSTTFQWSTSDFRALIDYIIAQDLTFITIQDFKNLANGSIIT